MDFKNLNTFMHAAELQSFTRAGDRLGYSQSTISFQIKQLESELGFPLFERINHTISLTEQGKRLLSCAHKISEELENFHRDSSTPQELTGTVRLALADSLSVSL